MVRDIVWVSAGDWLVFQVSPDVHEIVITSENDKTLFLSPPVHRAGDGFVVDNSVQTKSIYYNRLFNITVDSMKQS